MGDDTFGPWDADGQEILERVHQRIEALFEIATTADDAEAEILQEEVDVLELLIGRGRESLDPGGR